MPGNMVLTWAVTIAVLLFIEALTQGLTTIWFAAGGLAALLTAALGLDLWIQIGVFAGVSLLMLLLTRPIAVRYLNTKVVHTNADSLIGKEAVVIERIDNIQGTGAARIEGKEWTARSVRPEQTIEAGEIVMVRSIEGVKLMVGRRIYEDQEV